MSIIKLTTINIKGFRSIEEIDINLNRKAPLILVGKNECGKSNIIKAFYLLSGEGKFDMDDEKIMSEIDENCVRYFYNIDEKWLRNKIKIFFEENDISDNNHIYGKENNIDYFTRKFTESVFRIFSGQALSNAYITNTDSVNSDWYKGNSDIIGKKYIHKNELIKKSIDISTALKEKQIFPMKMLNVMSDLYDYLNDDCMNYKPKITYWSYKEESHQLPKSVLKEDFKNNPDSYLPLKNMFWLAGFDSKDIKDEITKCQESKYTDNMYRNLLKRVNQSVEKYVKKSWAKYKQEYKDVKIELYSDGEEIKVSIADKQNHFEFEQRSDGFRRFISFLLMQAVVLEKDKNNERQNIILIDEPEIGLHPSSAKDLKNKLFELSNNALIIYCTHSISMIDTDNVENNMIVTKKGEDTKIEVATEDGISSGESIYNAIGYSIYDELKKQNIIVEGISDKKIMQEIFKNEKSFENIGICYSRGVTGVEKITPFLDLASREYVVLSDADYMGKKYQKEFGNNNIWFTYEDLEFKYITIEDFLKDDFIKDTMQKIEILKDLDYNIEEYNKIEKLNIYLKQNKATLKTSDDDIKAAIKDLKDLLFDNYEKKHLEEDKLLEVLKAIAGKLTDKADDQ